MHVARCDLHTHTWYSDGRAAPAELVARAVELGLAAIAITDHDNTRGVREALPLAARHGLELVPAIELTCRWEGCTDPQGGPDIDLLGYFVDLDDPAFQAFERVALEDMHARITDCCAALSAAGYPLDIADVLVENPRYAGLSALIKTLFRKGYAAYWKAATALLNPFYQQVRPCCFSIDQVIAAINAAGGVAVLAHPVLATRAGEWLQAPDIATLVEMGLGGIEVYHPRLDDVARAYFLDLAQRAGLAVSGGSDEHGWPQGLPRLGSEPVTPELLAQLRARCPARR